MIRVSFTDHEHTEEWSDYEIHESGDWVILSDESETDQVDIVPRERVKDIETWPDQSELSEVQGDSNMPSDWPLRKQRVLVRDGFMCQNCWKMGGDLGPKELEVHHIVPRALSIGTHRLTNLITLCKNCHKNAPTVQ